MANKRKKRKGLTAQNKKLIIMIMSIVLAVSILTSLFFGFKLFAFGKDIKITYVLRGGSLATATQTVEVCKKYKLPTPQRDDYQFMYWSLDKEGKKKVDISGIWLNTTVDVTLYANWGRLDDEDEWTKPY